MPSGNFIFTIIAVIVGILALCKMDFGASAPMVEGWWGGIQMTPVAMPAAKVNGQTVAIGGNYMSPNMMGSGKFVSTPSFQSVLSPRFSNTQYGANIRYNMPDRENMAVPCDPLTFGSMAQENYLKQRTEGYTPQQQRPQQQVAQPQGPKTLENYECGNCTSPPSCAKGGGGAVGSKFAGGYELPSGYAAGNYWDTYNSIPGDKVVGGDLPVGTMTTMDGAGNLDQVVMVQHIMPANNSGSSRLRSMGDPIRGDLAIVPCQSGWFSVYPNIARDVQEGAMNVLAGAGGGGESYNKLMNLIVSASGGANTTLGGVDLAQSMPQYSANMAVNMQSDLSAAMGDITVSAFP